MFCGQGSEQPAAGVSLCDGGGHAGPEEPETLCRGSRSQLVRALSQLPAREAAGALPHTHLHKHTGEIRTGNRVFYLLILCFSALQTETQTGYDRVQNNVFSSHTHSKIELEKFVSF